MVYSFCKRVYVANVWKFSRRSCRSWYATASFPDTWDDPICWWNCSAQHSRIWRVSFEFSPWYIQNSCPKQFYLRVHKAVKEGIMCAQLQKLPANCVWRGLLMGVDVLGIWIMHRVQWYLDFEFWVHITAKSILSSIGSSGGSMNLLRLYWNGPRTSVTSV